MIFSQNNHISVPHLLGETITILFCIWSLSFSTKLQFALLQPLASLTRVLFAWLPWMLVACAMHDTSALAPNLAWRKGVIKQSCSILEDSAVKNVKCLKLHNFLPPLLDFAHLLTVCRGHWHLQHVQISACNSKYSKSYALSKFVCFHCLAQQEHGAPNFGNS